MLSALSVIRTKPVELAAALLMIIVGLVGSWFASQPQFAALAKFLNVSSVALSTMGGLLISHTVSRVNAIERAAETLRPQLSQANMVLANITYQIGRLIRDFAEGHIDASTALMIIQRNYDSLRSCISVYEQITGQNVEIDRLKQTLSGLDNMKKMFSSDESDSTFKKILEERIDELRSEILPSNISSTSIIADRVYETEDARLNCINCARPVMVRVRLQSGSTAHAHCENCASHFPVHRASDGALFYGGVSDGTQVDLPPYHRILKRQKFPLIDPHILEVSAAAIQEQFATQPQGKFDSRAQFEDAIHRAVAAKIADVPESIGRDAWLVAYKSKLFQLVPNGGGVKLRPGLRAGDAIREIREEVVRRLMDEVDEPLRVEEVCDLVAHDKRSRDMVIGIVQMLRSTE